ncbi:hypothetical protein [Arthrobacter sp. NA-172]|uniref:hypothetical protein n=1 Tax=Arthrobacter sp. NA-172 TaxID=3367524 RepID=UPI00375406B4
MALPVAASQAAGLSATVVGVPTPMATAPASGNPPTPAAGLPSPAPSPSASSASAQPPRQPVSAASASPAPPITVTVGQVSAQPGGTFTGTVDGLDALLPAQATLTRTFPASPTVTTDCVLNAQATNRALSCALPGNQAQGAYEVSVTQAGTGGKTRTGTSSAVYVVQSGAYDPRVTGPGLPIAPGAAASIKGTGFVPGGTVSLSTGSVMLPGGTATADPSGNFDFALTPSPFTTQGQYFVNVVDDITGVSAQLSVYVLRPNAALSSTVSTGVAGGYSTTISGAGFSAGSYALDLTLYNSDGTTVVSQLAQQVAVQNGALVSTPVAIPAITPPGLYQVAATSGDARLAATWIAVFPKPTVLAPVTPAAPVVAIVPVAPLPTDPTVKAPAPAPVPLIHQIIAVPATDPFAGLANSQVPDLNSSSTNAANGGLLGKDPTPTALGQTSGSPGSPAAQDAPAAAASTQVSTTSDFPWWLLVLVALIAVAIGLAGGYGIAATGRKRP